jgi:hypothetical protein
MTTSKLTVRVASALALVSLAGGIAAADPADQTAPSEPKDRTTALVLSIAGTAASGALVVAGLSMNNDAGAGLAGAGVLSSLVTPSIGEIYAGQPLTIGMGARTLGAALVLAGAAQSLGSLCLSADNGPDSCSSSSTANPNSSRVLLGIGATAYVAGIVYDIVDAPRAADRYNAHHFVMAPTVMQTASGTTAGVGLSGTF